MAIVEIEGMFMNSELKTSNYDGKEKTQIVVDLYQQKSTQFEKTVQLKSDDVSLLQTFAENYDFGSMIKVKAAVNAYQNRAYYKLLEVLS